MPESSHPSERSSKDLVRIVYHAQDRTFARLFKERTLDEVRDVVRRKLGLGPEIDVSLKQMGPDALLDLEDDDDFQAFRVLLRSSVSVDIQVTVGKPRSAPVATEQPLAIDPPITSSPSGESVPQAAARSKEAGTTEPFAATKKTSIPAARKRKVSFGETTIATPDGSTERREQPKSIAAPAKTPKTPVTLKSAGTEEPPKKKQKKESVRAKDVQSTEGVESPTKVLTAAKPKAKKSAASDRGNEASTSAPKDGEPSELPAKKSKRPKKDDGTLAKKSSASRNPDDSIGVDSQPNLTDYTSQLAPEKRARLGTRSGVSKARQTEKIGVCASIPQTSASTSVRSEVAAAIVSGLLSKGSESISPAPPAKPISVKKPTKKSSASSNAIPLKPTTVNASSSITPDIPAEQRHEHEALTNDSLQARRLNGPPCPICLTEPFHIRYRCPTVLKGPDAIRERLEEVKKSNVDDQQSLIKELEGLLRDTEVGSGPSLDAAPAHEVQPREATQPFNPSVSLTPNIPSNSRLSEVTVESKGEGSSSESSDDAPEGMNEHDKESPASGKQKVPDRQLSPTNDDLEAIIRGPALGRQSILHVIDRIAGDEENKGSDSDSDSDSGSEEVGVEVEVESEGEVEEEFQRWLSQSSKYLVSPSDLDGEQEVSRSPLPTSLAKDNLEHDAQGPDNSIEESTEHQDDDVVMRDCTDPPVSRSRDDDNSKEIHMGSEDRMVVVAPTGEQNAATVVEEHLSALAAKAPALQPSDTPSNESPESRRAEVDLAANEDRGVPLVSKDLNGVEDPIEPADDFEPPTMSRTSNADPIEAPPEDTGALFAGLTQSTPKPGVTKRIKTRNGQILGDGAERPVLLGRLASHVVEEATPLPIMGKSREKITETPAGQEQTSTRRRTRSSSFPPLTSTPAAVALLNHRAKVGTRSVKAAKTPAKRPEQRTDASQNGTKDDAQNGTHIAATPSLVSWETLAEPSSPPPHLDEPARVDELMSSSPQLEDNHILERSHGREKKSTPRTPALSSVAKISRKKERLFDLTSSQIPFPYSQKKSNPAPMVPLNGKEREVATDSEEEKDAKVTKKRAKSAVPYRPLSQLASQAALFSPSLPTPTNKLANKLKTKKRAFNKDSSSSSSSSDEDEASRSEHIPRGRRAGAVLETKKRKSLLSRV